MTFNWNLQLFLRFEKLTVKNFTHGGPNLNEQLYWLVQCCTLHTFNVFTGCI